MRNTVDCCTDDLALVAGPKRQPKASVFDNLGIRLRHFGPLCFMEPEVTIFEYEVSCSLSEGWI